MATQVQQLFEPVELATSAMVIYTAPSSPPSIAVAQGRVRFTNTTSGAVAVTAYAVPNGGSATASNCFMNAESVAQNQHVDVDLPVLGPGDKFEAFAGSGTSITCTSLQGVLFS